MYINFAEYPFNRDDFQVTPKMKQSFDKYGYILVRYVLYERKDIGENGIKPWIKDNILTQNYIDYIDYIHILNLNKFCGCIPKSFLSYQNQGCDSNLFNLQRLFLFFLQGI